MPKTSLVDDAKNKAPVPEKPANTLPAKADVSSTAFAMLPDSPIENLPEVTGPVWANCPSLVFAYKMSETFWDKLKAANPGLQEGDPCIVFPEPDAPVKLNPLRFSLLRAFQYWAISSKKNEHLECSLTQRKGKEDGKSWDEWIESILVIYDNGEAFPCAARLKSTKCPPIHLATKILNQLRDTKNDGPQKWAAQSPEHAMTMQIPKLWARFTVQCKISASVGKESGNTYHVPVGTVLPATAADLATLQQAFNDPLVQTWLKAADTQFEERIAAVKKLCRS
jgi:hypothetical protein